MGSQLSADTFFGPTQLSEQQFDTLIINGPAQLEEIKTTSLTVNGPIQFTDLEVFKTAQIFGPVSNSEKGTFEKIKVTGSLSAQNVQCNELTATGSVDIRDWTIKNRTTVIGLLHAQNSKFSDLEITSNKVSLENTTVDNIMIKRSGDNKVQELFLTGATIVNGNITFESGKGKIIAEKTVRSKAQSRALKIPTKPLNL